MRLPRPARSLALPAGVMALVSGTQGEPAQWVSHINRSRTPVTQATRDRTAELLDRVVHDLEEE